jgi:hypothetical protein
MTPLQQIFVYDDTMQKRPSYGKKGVFVFSTYLWGA